MFAAEVFVRAARCHSVESVSHGWAMRRRRAVSSWEGDRDCACCWACHHPVSRRCFRASDCASGLAKPVVAVRRAVSGLRRHLGSVNNCSRRQGASDVTDAQASECLGEGTRLLTRRVNGARRVHDAVGKATI
jgi:hypothetical protein